jgi:gas vesicle protein
MAKDNGKFSAFVTGFLAGSILGSAVSLLYSPMSGRKLRKKISSAKDDLVDDVNEYYEAGKEKAEDLIKEGKKKAEGLISDAKKIVSN